MAPPRIARPGPDEHLPYYARYIDLVPGDDAAPALASQHDETRRALAGLDEAGAAYRYAPGKWSVKQVLGHVADVERVFSYRALRIARGDLTPLPGMDERAFAEAAGSEARTLASLVDELGAVRAASRTLFEALDPEALERRGTANDSVISARALAWIIAGHERHHLAILRERYRIGG